MSITEKIEGLANAKHHAERGLRTGLNDADFARVIDRDGTGTEAASIRRDTMVWDHTPNRPQ